ncbi:MAG: PPE family protein, SVP subgroup, partial [Mycobacterium sp.]
EAHYGEMWAQDAAAMYGYSGQSAAAAKVPAFTAPAQTTNPAALAGQAATVAQATGTSAGTGTQTTLSQLTSAVPTALQQLASPASATSSSSTSGLSGITSLLTGGSSGNTALDNLWNEWGPNANIWNTIFSSGFYMPSNTMGAFTSLLGAGAAGNAAGGALGQAATGGVGAGLAGPLGGLGGLGGLGSGAGAASAALGQAPSIGSLSVPPGWTAAAPPVTPLAPALGNTPLSAPPAVATGMPGVAPTGIGGRGSAVTAIADTRFLVRPPMVPSWPAVG